jgi:hypothetical protein
MWSTRTSLTSNMLTDKVEINLNMLGALVLNGIGAEVDDAEVVVVDQCDP